MKIYATFSPDAVVLGGFQFESYIREDLKRFRLKQLKHPKQALPKSLSVVGFDTEYSPNADLLTVAVADRTRSKAIETTDTHWKATVAPIIRKAKILVGHSIAGDLDYLVKNKLAKEDWLRGINVLDSFLLARMVDENKGRGGYALEALMLSEFATTPWKDETAALLKKTGDASDWTPEQRKKRCALDAYATLLLANKFQTRVQVEINEIHDKRLT